jgi:hypothetical protein
MSSGITGILLRFSGFDEGVDMNAKLKLAGRRRLTLGGAGVLHGETNFCTGFLAKAICLSTDIL